MSQQPDSIFDELFEQQSKPRRLSVLSWWIKGYLILVFILAIYALFMEVSNVSTWISLESNSFYYTYIGFFAVITVAILLAAIISIGLEWKHGIMATIIAVICRTTYFNITMLSFNFGFNYNLLTTVIINLPFLILMIKVRKRWENEAIRKPRSVE
ncbi:hypothetical protein DVR12_20905 [Chitinophaga silvatica]|uniref:Uncharacterized protein n=1 Tax=Chitinophaga silvatica TaxID=2282649 RepID=A0A3E1Y6J5_9BACT|nr:hypothetical protein [Chitinophaga silvatica]RFS20177.1 hypothetical protein DVR12_20905 [Chitinophaga silvatica]